MKVGVYSVANSPELANNSYTSNTNTQRMQYLRLLFAMAMAVAMVHGERQEQVLNRAGTYVLGWDTDFEKQEITFDVTVETTGFVGFGINHVADMKGADIVMGGVDENGVEYFSDRHATSKSFPLSDTQQDWNLLEATENGTHTYLKFTRSWNTCDGEEDMIITKDTLTVIWSFGETDDLASGHSTSNRGGRSINFLDPPKPPADLDKLMKVSVRVNDTVPSVHTSYLCTFHKFPYLEVKHHAVAMEVYLENDDAVRHSHHFAATQCFMDNTQELEDLIGKPALDCDSEYVLRDLKPNCRDMLFGWGIGGELVVLPDHVGIEVRPNEVYYVMLEMHYDNPDEKSGIQFEVGFDVYLTEEIRENEGAVIMVGAHILPSIIIPPLSDNYQISGHCSPEITSAHLPPEGVNVVSIQMHSHLAGRKMKLRHYRGAQELPWLAWDDNFDSDYQQTRELSEEVKFMPGDQITMECTFDTTWRSNVTIAGESTREEMCHAFIFYYPRMPITRCSSGKPLEEIYLRFGVLPDQTSWPLNPTILKPDKYKGKTFYEMLNEDVNWTPKLREDLAQDLRFGRHWASYELTRNTADPTIRSAARAVRYVGPLGTPPIEPLEERLYTAYPVSVSEYVPEVDAKCQRIGDGDSGASSIIVAPMLVCATLAILLSWK